MEDLYKAARIYKGYGWLRIYYNISSLNYQAAVSFCLLYCEGSSQVPLCGSLPYTPVGENISGYYIELFYCSPVLHWDYVLAYATWGGCLGLCCLCGTWHGVSGSGSGHGLWLLDLSLGVHGYDEEVA